MAMIVVKMTPPKRLQVYNGLDATRYVGDPNVLIDPDLTPVLGVEQQYWKINATSDGLEEMTPAEKVLADNAAARKVTLNGPHEADGRPIVVHAPGTDGLRTWFTGSMDDLVVPERGGGAQMLVSYAASEVGEKTLALDFFEPIEVHDGGAVFDPDLWNPRDTVGLRVDFPATAATETAGTGNANLANGAYIPAAANDGSHTIVLADAVPIPAQPKGTGFWSVDTFTGVITAQPAGGADYHLLDSPVCSYTMRKMPLGQKTGCMDVDAKRTEWVHPNWNPTIVVNRSTSSGSVADLAVWLLVYRPESTVPMP